MKVSIKKFDVEMDIKTKGIEIDIYTPDGKEFLGDLIVTKSSVIWCEGKTSRARGKKLSWKKFIEVMNGQ